MIEVSISLVFDKVWPADSRWPIAILFLLVNPSIVAGFLPQFGDLIPELLVLCSKIASPKKWMVFWGFGVFRLTSLASVKTYPLLIACGYNWLYILGTQGGIRIVFLITIIAVFIWESHGIAYSTTTRQPNQPTASPSVSLPGGTHHCGATGTAGGKAERSGGAKHWRCRSWLAGDNPQKSHW